MATTEAILSPRTREDAIRRRPAEAIWITAALSFLAIVIHGYHPYVEDGGVYLAGIKRLLNPQLYPAWTGFVTAHLKFSLFAPFIVGLVRMSHLGLMTVMLVVYAGSIWLTLFAGWQIARRFTATLEGRAGAVCLLTVMLTVPVAGTSLMLMDPYVTGRSISTPFGLLAIASALDLFYGLQHSDRFPRKSAFVCVGSLVVAAAAHPLMAAYAFGCVLLLGCVSLQNRIARTVAAGAVCTLSLVAAACLESFAPVQSAAYATVARTRNYWFLSTWHWYEVLGLVAPLLVLLAVSRRRGGNSATAERRLARMATIAGITAAAVALVYARGSSSTFMVARLQPLRVYQLVYLLMILALGAFAGEVLLKRDVWRWLILLVGGGSMFFVQQQTFPHSGHAELPWAQPVNAWEQAFLWVRHHTPSDAVVALDANYITAPGEDSQNARAMTERSTMPDYAKDGGIASIAPDLTQQWMEGEIVLQKLHDGVTQADVRRLRALSVGWLVLPRDTPVPFKCAYSNDAVKVCRLPDQGL